MKTTENLTIEEYLKCLGITVDSNTLNKLENDLVNLYKKFRKEDLKREIGFRYKFESIYFKFIVFDSGNGLIVRG